MEAIKIYTREQISSAERLAQIIAKIPEDNKTFAIAVMNAYTDGFAAGHVLENNADGEKKYD